VPEAETLSSFTELNPYGRWTFIMATSKTKAVGMLLAQSTKAPTNRANPPTSSVPIVSQAAMCGAARQIAAKCQQIHLDLSIIWRSRVR